MHKKETKNTQSWLLSKYTQIHPHSCRVRKHYTCTHTPSGLKDTYKITQINPSLPFKQILCCLSLCISTHTHTLESSASINIINLKSSQCSSELIRAGRVAAGPVSTGHNQYTSSILHAVRVCVSEYICEGSRCICFGFVLNVRMWARHEKKRGFVAQSPAL